MTRRQKALVSWVGAGIALAGAIVTIVYIFQPWRTCLYDDAGAACGMLPADAAVMTTAMLGGLVGLALLGVGLFGKGVDAAR
jgi:hypothetical protein